MAALQSAQYEAAAALIAQGCRLDIKNGRGWTAADFASNHSIPQFLQGHFPCSSGWFDRGQFLVSNFHSRRMSSMNHENSHEYSVTFCTDVAPRQIPKCHSLWQPKPTRGWVCISVDVCLPAFCVVLSLHQLRKAYDEVVCGSTAVDLRVQWLHSMLGAVLGWWGTVFALLSPC